MRNDKKTEAKKKEEKAQRNGQQHKGKEAVGEHSGQIRKFMCESIIVYPI